MDSSGVARMREKTRTTNEHNNNYRNAARMTPRLGPHGLRAIFVLVVVLLFLLASSNHQKYATSATSAELLVVAPAFDAIAQLSAPAEVPENDWPNDDQNDASEQEKTTQVIGDNHEQLRNPSIEQDAHAAANDLRAHDNSERSVIDNLESNSLIGEQATTTHTNCSTLKCPVATNGSSEGLVCASNGRTYESMCELRRAACELSAVADSRVQLSNRRLHAIKSMAYCKHHNSAQLSSSDELSCTRHEYRDFKLALWREFQQNSQTLFHYLDENSDGKVEARELWPRQRNAQLADELGPLRAELTLEPYFSWSPCALAHLMSFELNHEGDTFTLDQLTRAFDEFSPISKSPPVVDTKRAIETTELRLELSESRLIACLTVNLRAQLEQHAPNHKANCLWTRLGVNLGSLEDEHLQLSARSKGAPHMRALYLRDAQLYLSGPFECTCQVDHFSFVHKYSLQVIAKPRASVRPAFQWSPPSSRVSFECQHDFIDTTSGSSIISIDWLKRSFGSREWLVIDTSGFNCTLTSARTRLNLEHIQANDSGDYLCRINAAGSSGEASGQLVVSDQQPEVATRNQWEGKKHLWMFHGGGISVYELRNNDELELDLMRELRGQSEVSGEVDGNWNQLTLCGGVGVEQAVICEWSDNAIEISVGDYAQQQTTEADDERHEQTTKHMTQPLGSYIYVGQPNLNRLIVLDSRELSIVALVSTEAQPRQLFAYEPNKIHLNKWVRRRLSPLVGSRWLEAIKHTTTQAAHAPFQFQSVSSSSSSKSSRLYSEQNNGDNNSHIGVGGKANGQLVQRDIWLLCYGQPLVPTLDPAHETFDSATPQNVEPQNITATNSLAWPLVEPPHWAATSRGDGESQLRNRKSIQIIQSTFFTSVAAGLRRRYMHNNNNDVTTPTQQQQQRAVNEFKRLTVLTTHYVTPAVSVTTTANLNRRHEYQHHGAPTADLVQDLSVPMRARALATNSNQHDGGQRAKLHYAYATHFNERHLYRIAMDTYHYDRAIDLAPTNCQPISGGAGRALIPTPQGLLVIQCQSAISHQLTGQLVLDELTSSQLEFNTQIRAQSAYLSPDSRYLVSIYSPPTPQTMNNFTNTTIIYVQLITINGLKFQYEIKTALDIGQCAFVWRDGQYVAVFVAQNKRDFQTELLSLRLADSRLELMVRVPGLAISSTARHRRDPLNIEPELKIASLTTSEATHIVDLSQNRITQTLAEHHQSSPTLLWL